MKRGLKQKNSTGRQTLVSKVSYVKRNWQLYVFFLMPALVLTIIFKYLPMGGLLIAFEDYNVIKGVFGSPWVGLEYFKRFLSSPDFMSYLLNTLKLSIYGLLWGFPIPIILALLLNRIRKQGIKKKIQLLIYAPNFTRYHYKLDDNADCLQDNLYCKRNLAGSRLGIHHVHGSFGQCQQRIRRSGCYGWCKSAAANLVCRVAGH